jgi:hypothetical protein
VAGKLSLSLLLQAIRPFNPSYKKIMKQLKIGIAALCLFNSSQAASVSLNNVGTSPFTSLAIAYSGTSTAATGGIAAAGYFGTLTDAQVFTLSSDLGNIGALIADFQVVAMTTLDSAFGGTLSSSGLFDFNAAAVTLPNASLAGKGLYTFLGNEATLGASTQWLLWDNTDVIDAQDTIAQPDDNSLLMAQEGGALISGGTTNVLIDFTPIMGPSGQSVPAIQLAAIPEPSALLLSTFGVLGLLRRKR